MAQKRLLVIAAHPDDEILGSGGAVAKLVDSGYRAAALILSQGVASRKEKDTQQRIAALKAESDKAAEVIGFSELEQFDFPDNRFDSVDLLDLTKSIESYAAAFKPDLVFTHHRDDLNIDHRCVYEATITAMRPMAAQSVRGIYAFETPSATEWRWPQRFSPNTFFDVSHFLDRKMQALGCYRSEMRDYPHPRSLEHVERLARVWGAKLGVGAAEAFECVWSIQ